MTTPNTVDALMALDLNQFAEICHNAHIDFALDKFPSYERAIEHHYLDHLNRVAAVEASASALAAMPAPTDLHAAIINLKAEASDKTIVQMGENPLLAYRLGHRDARHAAAELALNAPSPLAQQAGGVPAGCPPHAEIYVGSGKFAICDWADWPAVRAFNWKLTTKTNSGCQYAQAWDSHDSETRNRVTMHRLIFRAPDGMVVDHINGNGLDNRRQNLRHATHQQNAFNQSARPGTSKFKGVSFEAESNSWRAYIRADGQRKYLGRHKTEIEAAKAYNTAAKEHFGEYARINHVD